MSLELDIPPSWEQSAQQIVQQHWRKVLVLGAVDRGKSTYCHYLSQQSLAAGQRVAVIDTDVGQKDLGPPAALTLGYPVPGQALSAVQPVAWYFIGSTTPSGHLLPMVVGLRQLVEVARAACLIINTTGFVHGPGRVLKGFKIETVQPDVIVALEQGRELRAILHPYRHYRILRLPPSALASTKTAAQRRATRARAFGAYFANASDVSLAFARVSVQRSLLLTGRKLHETAYVHAEHTAEGLLAVCAGDERALPRGRVLPLGFERSLLCGVADRRNRGLGLALLQRLDFRQETLTVRTPVRADRIRVLQFGSLYLDEQGCELGTQVPPGVLG
ncbi:MAG: Clp1/GlmU family protein [Candidatus Tectimicrobiota bacterium]